ncbi:MAG: alpha/beta hydrolase [Phaeodactylibacter sp.]|nr:alpha/beta hydrolase [Phaeodactylibacter sp.]
MTKLLLLHGNGGAGARFQPFLQLLGSEAAGHVTALAPKLPGFEGRPLPEGDIGWTPFLDALQRSVEQAGKDGEWVLYGHGIGGSLLLEWASRGWPLADGSRLEPHRVILHGCIGASLQHRLFPKLMQPKVVRRLMQGLIAWPALQPIWERRLFLHPERIPSGLRRQFFRDYKTCAAFSLFFDLITPAWYQTVQEQLQAEKFYFIWGDKERVVASHFLKYWQQDFPHSTFDVVPGWDHFPMLDQPKAFYDKIVGLCNM